jgi:hypothetical protein
MELYQGQIASVGAPRTWPLRQQRQSISPNSTPHCVLLARRPLEEAFDNGYMCITWEGRHGDDRVQGEYRMFWLGPPELPMHDTKSYPWKSNDKLSSEAQAELRM